MKDELTKIYKTATPSEMKIKYSILPGSIFYKIFTKDRIYEKEWKINFP